MPVFAFFAAGVTVGGEGSLTTALTDPVAVGVVLGLLLGKPVGILGATWLVVRFTDSELDDDVQWRDLAAVSLLAGIGFTVSLLVVEPSFPADPDLLAHAKIAVLVAPTTAPLRRRRRARAAVEAPRRTSTGEVGPHHPRSEQTAHLVFRSEPE